MAKHRKARRLIISYARPDAYVPLARVILARMGYPIVPAEEWEDLPTGDRERTPDLRIVDERRLGEIPEDAGLCEVPMIVLTGRHGVTGANPRIVGAIARPAGLHEIYLLIQQTIEDSPRSTPRVATHLPARCRRGARQWRAAVLSLSENGCLLRTPEPLSLGSQIDLSFDLPRAGTIETQAESAYQLLPDTGLIFHRTPAAFREAILRFVEESLAVI
jgi:hypothetical protein